MRAGHSVQFQVEEGLFMEMIDEGILRYYKNIKDNFWPLTIIALFIIIFAAFLIRGSPQAEEEKKDKHSLTIGFYKQGEDEEVYFEKLKAGLEAALGNHFDVTFRHRSSLTSMCEEIRDGKLDIAGEFSPIEFVTHYKEYKFEPLVGIEYDESAYYHTYFFVLKGELVHGYVFEEKPGVDYLQIVKNMLKDNKDCAIAHLASEDSTSGFHYPRSFLIDNDIDPGRTKRLQKHRDIYEKVLRRKGDHKYIAGFLAGFRIERFKKDFEQDKYGEPLIVDKTDPIPNGVFVIAKAKKNDKNLQLDKLIRLWKSIRNVEVGHGTKITGWRTRMERDLNVVEEHWNKVRYYDLYKKYHQPVLAIVVVIMVIAISVFAYLYLKRS
jgi:ABC-type phosphate/phosphonate transport system substrate-binding protein